MRTWGIMRMNGGMTMPIDVLNEEVKGLTDEQIESVVVFVRGLKDKKD